MEKEVIKNHKITDLNANVIVTSDRCHQDSSRDSSGQFVEDSLKQLGFKKVIRWIIKDNKEGIISLLKKICNEDNQNALIITVGGTGLCPLDVTPDATLAVIDRECVGIRHSLLAACLQETTFAAFSRQTAGIAGETFIVNFPGKLNACITCWKCFKPLIGHLLEQIRFCRKCVDRTHTCTTHIADESPVAQGSRSIVSEVQVTNISSSSSDDSEPEQNNAINNQVNATRIGDNEKAPKLRRLSADHQLVTSALLADALGRTKTNGKKNTNKRPLSNLDSSPRSEISDGSTKKRVETKKHRVDDRVRTSKYPLFNYLDALRMLVTMSNETDTDDFMTIQLTDYKSALSLIGLKLHETYTSQRTIPEHPVSTMDGYCVILGKNNAISQAQKVVNVQECPAQNVQNTELTAIELSSIDAYEKLIAKTPSKTLQSDEQVICFAVNTGGRVPHCDSIIIPVEDTRVGAENGTIVLRNLHTQHLPGRYVRRPGADLSKENFIEAGTLIRPVELSLLMSMGINEVKVRKKRAVSLLSTGDEIVSPFISRQEHHKKIENQGVVDANGPLLNALLIDAGYAVYNGGIIADDRALLLNAITRALKLSNVLVVSGGASMGTKDYVKDIFETDLKGKFIFGRVNMKPGKPAAFGQCTIEGKPKYIFCLPGNPVSAFVTALVLVLPFLQSTFERKVKTLGDYRIPIAADYDIVNHVFDTFSAKIIDIPDLDEAKGGYEFDDRMEFLRAKVLGQEERTSIRLVSVSIRQQSSRLLSLMGCDCLLIIPNDVRRCQMQKGQIFSAFYIPQ